jgi:hypothetical protein
MDGIGGCPNVGGICIGRTMPGFPDKFTPFMDEPPGSKVSTEITGHFCRDCGFVPWLPAALCHGVPI